MKRILEYLFAHGTLTEEAACNLLGEIADGHCEPAQAAALLAVYRMRAVRPEELLGFRRALIQRAHTVDLSAYRAIDIVGTGGDGKNTFNISTCCCFIVAGAGYKVAKHGNYGASSVSGASTVLERHGVRFTAEADRLRHSIESCGVAYLHAPLFHPALAAVAPLRRAIGVKTLFNLLGPLVNPSRPAYQLLGVADLAQMRLYTQVLRRLDMGFVVVNSPDGYDEVSLTGDLKVTTAASETLCSPAALGLAAVSPSELSGGDTPDEASAIFDSVLQGTASAARRECVLANAAFAIRAICPGKPLDDCLAEARESLDSGRAWNVFRRFVELNG